MDPVTRTIDSYVQANRENWDDRVPIHVASDFYNLSAFRAGGQSLGPIEIAEVGDVQGRTLLHLQCHIGTDTISWARRGAEVTGVDFSQRAVDAARSLAAELGIQARFICADVRSAELEERFDIVFTSTGVLCWLPELGSWGRTIARHLAPGGMFYIFDGHPVGDMFRNADDCRELALDPRASYLSGNPIRDDHGYTYTDGVAMLNHRVTYEWIHPLSEIINALTAAGLRLEFLHEFPVSAWRKFPFMIRDAGGCYRIPNDPIPLTFSLKAWKP